MRTKKRDERGRGGSDTRTKKRRMMVVGIGCHTIHITRVDGAIVTIVGSKLLSSIRVPEAGVLGFAT